MAAVGAFYLLARRHEEYGRTFVRTGVIGGVISCVLMLFPTGDQQGKNIAFHQPVTLAAMEGLFQTENGAPLAIVGQPDLDQQRLDNPLTVPYALSFLTYQRWNAEVQGPRRISAGPVAGQHPAAVLQLSHHGGAGHDLHRRDGCCPPSLLRRGALYRSRPHAVDSDAGRCRFPISRPRPAGSPPKSDASPG